MPSRNSRRGTRYCITTSPQILLQHFGKGGIKVEEIGAAQVVAADVAKGARGSGSREARCREPRVVGPDAMKNLYGGNEIRRLRVTRRVERSATGREGHR